MEEIFNSWLVKQKIAHRGLHDEVSPENSLSAFKKAVEKGYAIETDVQMTADGILLAFHDEILDRMTDGKGLISQKNFNEICNYTLKNSEEKIPLLSEVLSLVGGKVPLLIEIKSHKNIKAEEEKIKAMLEKYDGQYAFQSFNPFIVKWFKDNMPDVKSGVLSSFFKDVKLSVFQKIILKNLWLNKLAKPDFISYNVDDAANFKKLSKIKGTLPILFWTVRSTEQMRLVSEKCDNIIFEGFLP